MRQPVPRQFSLLIPALAVSLLNSCGVDPGPGNPVGLGPSAPGGSAHLAVADWDNARVLIFDAPFKTGESASVVLGQKDFQTDDVSRPEGPSLMYGPEGIAIDADGNLYIADIDGGRIMKFQPPFQNGMDASLELGVPNFQSPGDADLFGCYQNPPAMSLCMPGSVTLDSSGDVWVADSRDGRVVEYPTPISQAMDAKLAIGQPDLDSTADCDGAHEILKEAPAAPNLTGREFCQPYSVTFDSHGNLWVSDPGNNRVLEFAPPFSTGMTASLELGYPAAEGMNAPTPQRVCSINSGPVVSASSFCGPAGLAFDAKGDLWVVDNGNNRIMEFSPPFSNGMAAILVLGQPNFTQGSLSPPAANTLDSPSNITFDHDGDLIISDSVNSRVLIFTPPFSNGMSASVVIGQTDMKTGTGHGCNNVDGAPTASTLCGPGGVLAF